MMVRNKKFTMLMSFCIGAAIFATTAFADVINKSGYEQLKDAIKYTTKKISDKNVDNFTMEVGFSIKDDDKVVLSNTHTEKTDFKNEKKEVNSTDFNGVKESGYYNYTDRFCDINKSSDSDKYVIDEYSNKRENDYSFNFQNPFEEDQVEDMEKVLDAFVGNLKDYLVVSEDTKGNKLFSGSISDSQIPAVVNALTSYFVKSQLRDLYNSNQNLFPELKDQIYVDKVSGKATVTPEGVLENIYGSCVLQGKDQQGKVHKLTMELLVKFINFNSTIVSKPDLTGKKVEKNTYESDNWSISVEKYIGKWKSDIIKDNNGLEKIGERIIEITSVDENNVYGKYYEIYKDSNTEKDSILEDFEFKVLCSDGGGSFEDINGKGIKGHINFYNAKISLYPEKTNSSRNVMTDDSFTKVFE